MPQLLPPNSYNVPILARVRQDYIYSWTDPTSPILRLHLEYTTKDNIPFNATVRLQMFYENAKLAFAVFCFDEVHRTDSPYGSPTRFLIEGDPATNAYEGGVDK